MGYGAGYGGGPYHGGGGGGPGTCNAHPYIVFFGLQYFVLKLMKNDDPKRSHKGKGNE